MEIRAAQYILFLHCAIERKDKNLAGGLQNADSEAMPISCFIYIKEQIFSKKEVARKRGRLLLFHAVLQAKRHSTPHMQPMQRVNYCTRRR